jgi:hypothetical protein
MSNNDPYFHSDFPIWNMVFRGLIQVTCGYISQNMRRVSLRRENGDWIVEVILEKDDPEDRQEIAEFASELWLLIENDVDGEVSHRIIIEAGSRSNFPLFEGLAGVMFLRKE